MATPGNWNILGVNLPDYGITEKLFGPEWGNRNTTPTSGLSAPLDYNNSINQTLQQNPQVGPTYSGSNVLGAKTSNVSTSSPTPAPSGFNVMDKNANPGPGYWWDAAHGWKPYTEPSPSSYEDQMRSNIENAYGDYNRRLDEIYNNIPGQAEAQRGIVGNQYQQGVNSLTSQRDIGLRDLSSEKTKTEESQKRSMKDLAEAMRNQFMSGQVMLGAKGAGDSSAVNQYSYALTKLGNKQRGDLTSQTASIINDINDKEFKLKTTYNSEINDIASTRDSQLNSIAQWLSEQQNTIRQLQAEGGLRKGQDLNAIAMTAYNEAINRANQVNTLAQNKTAMLEEWAANNSQNINQLKQNLAGVSAYTANPPAFQGIQGEFSPGGQGQQRGLYGGYVSDDEKQRGIFS